MNARRNGRERRTSIGGQFAPRLIEMLESPAFRVLSVSANRVLARIEIEMGHHGGTDNGRLPVTFGDFEQYGIERHAIAPAIRELTVLGFIEVTVPGRAGNAEWRAPNLFRLTYRHSKGVQRDGTHEWRRIATIEGALALAKAARKTPPQKTESQCGFSTSFSAGNPHRKPDIPVRETPTTDEVGKPPLLSISPGGTPDNNTTTNSSSSSDLLASCFPQTRRR
jgi:hypothetical protein